MILVQKSRKYLIFWPSLLCKFDVLYPKFTKYRSTYWYDFGYTTKYLPIYYCDFGTSKSKNLIFDYYYTVYLVIYCDFVTNKSKITNFWALYIYIYKYRSKYYCDLGTQKSKILDFWPSLSCKFDLLFPKFTKYRPIY